jgi:hypothetical protein
VGCRTVSKRKFGIAVPFMEIYKNGNLEFENKKSFFFKDFKTSKDYPLVKLCNKPIIEFDKENYNKKGSWIYNIDYEMEDCKVNLRFEGITKGFKIETKAESWAVALPKAKVKGSIEFNRKKMVVEGTGYHDHNWNYTILTAINYGKAWYWGKINGEKYNIVWANVVKKSGKWDLIVIVNKGLTDFYNINQENIILELDNFIYDHHRKTPTKYVLKFDDVIDSTSIVAEIEMNVIDLHYNSVFFSPYWRYHVHATGFISVDNHEEKIDNVQIMEFLRFT